MIKILVKDLFPVSIFISDSVMPNDILNIENKLDNLYQDNYLITITSNYKQDYKQNNKQNYKQCNKEYDRITNDSLNILTDNINENIKCEFKIIGDYEFERKVKFNAKTLEMIDKDLAKKYAQKQITQNEVVEEVKYIMSN